MRALLRHSHPSAAALLACLLAGCGSSSDGGPASSPVCAPGSVAACSCGVFRGAHVCDRDGSGYDSCVCGAFATQGYGGATAGDPATSSAAPVGSAVDCGAGPVREGCSRACQRDDVCTGYSQHVAWLCGGVTAPQDCRAVAAGIVCCAD